MGRERGEWKDKGRGKVTTNKAHSAGTLAQ